MLPSYDLSYTSLSLKPREVVCRISANSASLLSTGVEVVLNFNCLVGSDFVDFGWGGGEYFYKFESTKRVKEFLGLGEPVRC